MRSQTEIAKALNRALALLDMDSSNWNEAMTRCLEWVLEKEDTPDPTVDD
jgi:hypothetical protein